MNPSGPPTAKPSSDLSADELHSQETCPVCAAKSKCLGAVRTIDPNSTRKVELRECSQCRHWWVNPIPTQALLDRLYAAGSLSVIGAGWDTSPKVELSVPEQFVLTAEQRTTKSNYLEVGVGKGLLFSRARARGWNCFGVEPGDWGETTSGIHRSLKALPAAEKFDIIVAIDVLEHVSSPTEFLAELRAKAAPSCRLYAAFPCKDSPRAMIRRLEWSMIRPFGHLHFFSSRSVQRVFADAGWSVTRKRKTDLWPMSRLRELRPSGPIRALVEVLQLGDQWLVTGLAGR